MRTRIALVAIAPIAGITLASLSTAATARAVNHSPLATARLTSYGSPAPAAPAAPSDLNLSAALTTGKPAGTKEVTPVIPYVPPRPVVVDTVTPAQRAAWDRVAMCEEGGNWTVDGGRFSGGLGITRANWVIFGGLQYAPRAALATPDQQIMVAERIQSNPPDQNGCASW